MATLLQFDLCKLDRPRPHSCECEHWGGVGAAARERRNYAGEVYGNGAGISGALAFDS